MPIANVMLVKILHQVSRDFNRR